MSPWWLFRQLALSGLREGPERRSQIRTAWSGLQEDLFESAYEMASRGTEMLTAGRETEASRMLTEYMEHAVARMLDRARSLAGVHA